MKTYLLSLIISAAGVSYFVACTTETDATPSASSTKSNLLALVNDLRRSGCQCGEDTMPPVPALDWNEVLVIAARRHAKDMAAHDHFDHIGTDGSSSKDRITDTGYPWTAYGENIAYGFTRAKAVIKMWTESEGHCKNMMSPAFKEMGVAHENGYWVQVLGTAR